MKAWEELITWLQRWSDETENAICYESDLTDDEQNHSMDQLAAFRDDLIRDITLIENEKINLQKRRIEALQYAVRPRLEKGKLDGLFARSKKQVKDRVM